MILKMSEVDLFEIEFKDISENINLNIDQISLFKEIEQELSKNLFKTEGEEDLTDGPLNFIENWQTICKQSLTRH